MSIVVTNDDAEPRLEWTVDGAYQIDGATLVPFHLQTFAVRATWRSGRKHLRILRAGSAANRDLPNDSAFVAELRERFAHQRAPAFFEGWE